MGNRSVEVGGVGMGGVGVGVAEDYMGCTDANNRVYRVYNV